MKRPRASEPPPVHAPADRRRTYLGVALLAALVAAIYWPTLSAGFVSDDIYYVDANKDLASLAGLRSIWTDFSVTPQYYPLVHTLLWVEYHLWGLDPLGYHAVSMVLHLVVVLLVWRLLTVLKVPGAWLAAALFAVHPVEVESVAWVSEQKNLTSTSLALGAMLLYLRFWPADPQPEVAGRGNVRDSRRWGYYAGALALYVAAMLCKTVVVSTPAVLLVIYWWKRGRLDRRDVLPLVPFFVVGISLACVTVYVERTYVGAKGAAWEISFPQRILIAGRAVWFYIGKLILPYPIAFFYPRWEADPSAIWQYLYPLAAGALLLTLFLLRHRIGRGPLAAALIFGGILMPALGFFDVYWFLYSYVADHFQYQASIAPLALAAAGLTGLFAALWQSPPRWAASAAAALLLAPLACAAHRCTDAYLDRRALAIDVVESSPESWAGHYLLAGFLLQEKQYAEAVNCLRQALELFPQHEMMRIRLALGLAEQGKADEAMAEYQRALAGKLSDFDQAEAHLRLGLLFKSLERTDDALEQFRSVIRLAAARPNPSMGKAYFNAAALLQEKEDLAAALPFAQESARLQPESASAQALVGIILLDGGQAAQAVEPLKAASKLDPKNAQYCLDLGRAFMQSGQGGLAEAALRRAIALDARSAAAHNLLGVVFGQRNDLPAAIQQFQTALEIDPKHTGAATNLKRAQEAQQTPSK